MISLCTISAVCNICYVTAAESDWGPGPVLLQLQVCQPSWSPLLVQQRLQQHWLRHAWTALPGHCPPTVSGHQSHT